MNFDEYQKEAMYFRMPTADSSYALLNLCGEVGELYSAIAKQLRDGTDEDKLMADIKKLTDRKSRGVISGSGDER